MIKPEFKVSYIWCHITDVNICSNMQYTLVCWCVFGFLVMFKLLLDFSFFINMEHFLLKQIRTVTTNTPFQIGGSVTNMHDTGLDWCSGDCKCWSLPHFRLAQLGCLQRWRIYAESQSILCDKFNKWNLGGNTEEAMASHSSVLAWKIPWTGEPGGLLSMGWHRVGYNWSDLAAAAAKYLLLSLPRTYL